MQTRQKWLPLLANSGYLVLENGDIEIYPHPFYLYISSERENIVADKLIVTSIEQLQQLLEERMEESRSRIGSERIKAKSYEREGEVRAYGDAISLVRNLSRNQE